MLGSRVEVEYHVHKFERKVARKVLQCTHVHGDGSPCLAIHNTDHIQYTHGWCVYTYLKPLGE